MGKDFEWDVEQKISIVGYIWFLDCQKSLERVRGTAGYFQSLWGQRWGGRSITATYWGVQVSAGNPLRRENSPSQIANSALGGERVDICWTSLDRREMFAFTGYQKGKKEKKSPHLYPDFKVATLSQ